MRQPTLMRDLIELGILTVGGLIGMVCGLALFVVVMMVIGLIGFIGFPGPRVFFTAPWPQLTGVALLLAGMVVGIYGARAIRGPNHP